MSDIARKEADEDFARIEFVHSHEGWAENFRKAAEKLTAEGFVPMSIQSFVRDRRRDIDKTREIVAEAEAAKKERIDRDQTIETLRAAEAEAAKKERISTRVRAYVSEDLEKRFPGGRFHGSAPETPAERAAKDFAAACRTVEEAEAALEAMRAEARLALDRVGAAFLDLYKALPAAAKNKVRHEINTWKGSAP